MEEWDVALDRAFAIATLERALKTAAQSGLLALGATVWTDIDQVMSTAQAVGLAMLFGGILSVLTSLASAPFGPSGPSLRGESTDLVDLAEVDLTDPELLASLTDPDESESVEEGLAPETGAADVEN